MIYVRKQKELRVKNKVTPASFRSITVKWYNLSLVFLHALHLITPITGLSHPKLVCRGWLRALGGTCPGPGLSNALAGQVAIYSNKTELMNSCRHSLLHSRFWCCHAWRTASVIIFNKVLSQFKRLAHLNFSFFKYYVHGIREKHIV